MTLPEPENLHSSSSLATSQGVHQSATVNYQPATSLKTITLYTVLDPQWFSYWYLQNVGNQDAF